MHPGRQKTQLALFLLITAAAEGSLAQGKESVAAPMEKRSRVKIHVLFHSDFYGRFRWPGCRRPDPSRADYGNLISAVSAMRKKIEKDGDPPPVVVSNGNMLGPDALAKWIFGDRPTMVSEAVSLMKKVGYDGVGLGKYDLSATTKGLEAYLEQGHRKGLKFLAANLRCKRKNDVRCRYLGDRGQRYVIVRRGDVKIAIVGVVSSSFLLSIGPKRRKGLVMRDHLAELKKTIRTLRQSNGVHLVLVLANVEQLQSSPRNLLLLGRQMREEGADLIVGNALYTPSSRRSDYVAKIVSSSSSMVVGTDRFGQHLGHATLIIEKTDGGYKLVGRDSEQIPTVKYPPDACDRKVTEKMMMKLCRRLDVRLGEGVVKRPHTRREFFKYMLEIIRRRTSAELAILPDSLLADTCFPVSGGIRREFIHRAVRFSGRVGVIRAKGSWIKKKLAGYLGSTGGLVVLGLRKKGKLYYVNNRVLVDDQHYRVATTWFIAQGGENLVVDKNIDFTPANRLPSLRKMIMDWFENNRHRRPGKKHIDEIDLKKDFIPLHEKFLLSSTIDLRLSFADVSILNPGVYADRPQLARERIMGLAFNATINGKVENHYHSMSGTLTLKYGKTKTWVKNELTGITSGSTAETDDLIAFNFLYRMTRFHSKFNYSRFYYPIPFFEANVETEFTRDLEAQNGKVYRYSEVVGIVGPGFWVHPKTFLKVGFVAKSYKLTIPDEREQETGVYAGVTLDRHALVKVSRHPVYWESRLDFYLTDFRDMFRKELIWTNKVSFNLLSYLFLTVAHELYLYDTKENKLNVASNTLIGVQVLYDMRHQTF